MNLSLKLNLPKDQRIHPLAWAIWRAGIPPMSWLFQCPPDWLSSTDDAVSDAAMLAVMDLDYAMAMQEQIAAAEDVLNKQGKSLFVDADGNRVDKPNVDHGETVQ